MSDHPVDTLIIEDLDFMARELAQIVELLGHRVVGVATTSQHAIELAKHLKPGLIISGVILGKGGSGIDAVKEIRRELKVPVVFVTAAPEMALASGEADPACVVEKPFKLRSVEDAIRIALDAGSA